MNNNYLLRKPFSGVSYLRSDGLRQVVIGRFVVTRHDAIWVNWESPKYKISLEIHPVRWEIDERTSIKSYMSSLWFSLGLATTKHIFTISLRKKKWQEVLHSEPWVNPEKPKSKSVVRRKKIENGEQL